MLGSLMVPVMLARLPPTLATGPVMAIGAVDMLIPPSRSVLLGSLSGISISKLLIGRSSPASCWRSRSSPGSSFASDEGGLAPSIAARPTVQGSRAQAVPALCTAAGLDLRRRRRCDGGRLGHARNGRGRRGPIVFALAYRALSVPILLRR
jgi:hypothetical protein